MPLHQKNFLLIATTFLVMTCIPDAQSKSVVTKQQSITCGTDSKPCVVKVLPSGETSDASIGTSNNNPVYISVKDDKSWWQRFLTDPNATFSGAVALFTFFLFVVGGVQGGLIAKQIKLSRDEFDATHRPKLRVRRIMVNPLEPNKHVSIQMEISNIGDSEAKIIELGADIFFRSTNQQAPFVADAKPKPISIVKVNPGQQMVIDMMGHNPITEGQILNLGIGGGQLCLWGIVVYNDRNGIRRNTSFFRIYNLEYRKFMEAPESDQFSECEYED